MSAPKAHMGRHSSAGISSATVRLGRRAGAQPSGNSAAAPGCDTRSRAPQPPAPWHRRPLEGSAGAGGQQRRVMETGGCVSHAQRGRAFGRGGRPGAVGWPARLARRRALGLRVQMAPWVLQMQCQNVDLWAVWIRGRAGPRHNTRHVGRRGARGARRQKKRVLCHGRARGAARTRRRRQTVRADGAGRWRRAARCMRGTAVGASRAILPSLGAARSLHG
ncbi:MAG: hypothetical protein J3K34DRAFT_113392 [Monoraphidium minutum]|nr:MAG: hypothetical protein J3K34DRAFT_113392 [Monoraphidium minutum]